MSFTTGSTPFGIFDLDPAFQADADRIVQYTRLKLGDPVLQVELDVLQMYAGFEEACLEYSAIINQYQAISTMASFLGSATGSLQGAEQKYPSALLEFQKRLAEPYGGEAGVNSTQAYYTASIPLTIGQQNYDLNQLIIVTGSDGSQQRVFPKEIFHFNPLTAFRYFGTTSAVNYLNNQFSFESFTPETIFYLLPIWEDILRGMQFKTSNNVRRSHYSYDIQNNVLKLYPCPSDTFPLFLTYTLAPNPIDPDGPDPSVAGVSNLSNIPFGNIQYSGINSVGRQWIREMAFAYNKEILGRVRAKMQTIPIPNGDLQLDGNELVSDARAQQEQLRTDLKAMLDQLTYDKIAQRQADMAKATQEAIMNVPLGIYVG